MNEVLQQTLDLDDGGRLMVHVHGDPDSDALVIVPGAMSDAHTWRHVATAVTAWPTVVVMNRRGRRPSADLPTGHSLRTEIDDLTAVIEHVPRVRTLFGWSIGGLFALALAAERPLRHVIAYEPVIQPFGADALGDLRAAHEAGDLDATVEIVFRQVSGLGADAVTELRAHPEAWEFMRRLGAPAFAEVFAVNSGPAPQELAGRAGRVDLIVGSLSRGRSPYGTSFEDVRALLPGAAVHELTGQGHLAHREDPAALARLLDSLARPVDGADQQVAARRSAPPRGRARAFGYPPPV